MLDEYMIKHCPPSWDKFFMDENVKHILRDIYKHATLDMDDESKFAFAKQFNLIMPQNIRVVLFTNKYINMERKYVHQGIFRLSYVPYEYDIDDKTHPRLWRSFVLALLRWLSSSYANICFILNTNKNDSDLIANYITNAKNKIISTYDNRVTYKIDANQFLIRNGYPPIDW